LKRRPSQGRRLIEALKKRPMTYMEMNMLGISVSPHKRICESLNDAEQLVKSTDYDGRTTWRVVAATAWIA
jgi:hypothetical protein